MGLCFLLEIYLSLWMNWIKSRPCCCGNKYYNALWIKFSILIFSSTASESKCSRQCQCVIVIKHVFLWDISVAVCAMETMLNMNQHYNGDNVQHSGDKKKESKGTGSPNGIHTRYTRTIPFAYALNGNNPLRNVLYLFTDLLILNSLVVGTTLPK